jgi:hypothetical protein
MKLNWEDGCSRLTSGKKVCEAPFQQRKAGCGYLRLSSPQCGKLKIEASQLRPAWAKQKEYPVSKQPEQKGLEVFLK